MKSKNKSLWWIKFFAVISFQAAIQLILKFPSVIHSAILLDENSKLDFFILEPIWEAVERLKIQISPQSLGMAGQKN